MKRIVWAALGVFFLVPILCLAQLTVIKAMIVEIPFQFLAGEKLLPAGTYEIQETDPAGELKLTNAKSHESSLVQIFTRISERVDAEVMFDRTADQYYLSEVYMPGMDGFLIKGAPAKHTHVRVKSKSK